MKKDGGRKEGRKTFVGAEYTSTVRLKSERLSHGTLVFAQRRFPAKWHGTPRLVKGLCFSGSYGTRHTPRCRAAPRHAAPKANSAVFQRFRVNVRQTAMNAFASAMNTNLESFPMCTQAHRGRRKDSCSHARLDATRRGATTRSPSRRVASSRLVRVRRGQTRCYDSYYYCNYFRTLIYTRCTARRICMRFCASAGRNQHAGIGCV